MLVRAFLLTLGLFFASTAPLPLGADEHPMRVMALGDSITAGVGTKDGTETTGGYRGYLAQMLAAQGTKAIFVGSRTDFSQVLQQRAHEGWPGYVIRAFPSDPGPGQLYGSVTERALQTYHPDVVLLMAGTNDLLRLEKQREGYTLPAIEHSLHLLIQQIFNVDPHVHLIVAPVVASPKIEPCVVARFAGDGRCGPVDPESIAALVASYAESGYAITDASAMLAAVPDDEAHFPDRIHPAGTGGYAAIARVWFQALVGTTGGVQTGQR